MNRRHHPLDPEERVLARLLDDPGATGPSPELDARILAAARRSVPTAPPAAAPATGYARRGPRRRWPVALGLAASVTVAIGVAWQLREPLLPTPIAVEDAATAARPPEPAVAAEAAPVQPATVAAPPPSPAAAPGANVMESEHQAAAARQRSSDRTEQAARQADAAIPRPTPEPSAAAWLPPSDGYRQSPLRPAPAPPPAPPPPPALAPPAPAPAPAPAAAGIAAKAEALPRQVDSRRLSELQAASEPGAPAAFADLAQSSAGSDEAALEDDARLPAAEWLQRIRERQLRGDTVLARASLAHFVRAYPDVPVPDDLRRLAP